MLANAIVFPSGDQLGCRSTAGSVVSWIGLEPSAPITQMSPFFVNAISPEHARTFSMRFASSTNEAPRWSEASWTNAASAEQAPTKFDRASCFWASRSFASRPKSVWRPLVTSWVRAASCSAAPATCTPNEAVAVLPCVSEAVQVTVVVPPSQWKA